jgi:PiT family inorganic phosphate transporter
MVISVLFITVCFLAYANGANDNFKGVATLFGSGTANYRLALGWATAATLAGSICALFLAQTLMLKFSGKGLAPDSLIQSLPFMIAVSGGAGMTVILATRFGFPISTTHALLGAMLGSALPATLGSMNPAPLLNNFVLPLLLSPLAALLLAALLYQILHKLSRYTAFNQPLCLCVEQPDCLVLADSSNTAMTVDLSADPLSTLSIAPQTACAERDAGVVLGFDARRMIDGLHFCSAGAVCFARGLNDTPKIAALLLLAPGFNLQWIIVVIAVAMLLGGLFNAWRVAETMSHKITPITQTQGLSANLTTALLVIFASKFGMPVSTTHVSVGALFGIGLTGGKANTGVIASIALSWLLTLPCAAICSTAIYYVAAGI